MTLKPVYHLPPELEDRVNLDMELRLHANGLPRNQHNDYERHLYARKLRIEGYTREEVRAALFQLTLDDVSANKRESYVGDILNSILVGFASTEPILVPEGE